MPSDHAPLVSVCMATYNGARHIEAQLQSILSELAPTDEVVVVDDASSDDTVAIIERLGDPRVRVHRNASNLGYVRNFERAIGLAGGDVVFLSDQDDVWIPGRRQRLLDGLADRSVAASNLVLHGSQAPLRSPLTGRPWLLRARTANQRLRNQARLLLGDAPYYGCTMAVRRDAMSLVLPLPSWLHESHDLWIATVANAAGELSHVEAPTLERRVHDDNASASQPRGLGQVARSRVLLARMALEARRRVRRFRMR